MHNTSTLTVGDSAHVDMLAVRAHDSSPPYLRLVRELIRKGGGVVYVSSLPPNACPNDPRTAGAYIRAWSGDILGDVRVPLAALTRSPQSRP